MMQFEHDVEFDEPACYGRKPNSKSFILDDDLHCTVCPTRYVLSEDIASNSITLHAGYEMKHRVLPYWCMFLLTLFGLKPDIRMDFLLSVMYDESGFNEYSREDVDKLYVRSLFENSGVLASLLLKPIVWIVIGSLNEWNWRGSSNSFVHGRVEPYINYKYAEDEQEGIREMFGDVPDDDELFEEVDD